MKKLLALVLSFVMMFSLAACGSKKEDESEKVKIRVLGYSDQEASLNILRDQLSKAGFEVELNMQPDYSSMTTVEDSREWDIVMGGWTTVTGNPDYATRDIYASYGEYNSGGIDDEKVDALIDQAAGETPAQYIDTYKELEDYLVTEMAYTLPLYASRGLRVINQEVVDESTVKNPQSRSAFWENYSYVDTSLNETRTLWMYNTMALTSLDPIQANDGSINQLSSNINVRIINMTEDDQIESDGSLSLNYAIAEGNQAFYFILRDDVFFSKVEDKHVVGTDILVGGEDVVYSLTRAADKNSVASHKTYNLHNHMSNISVVADIKEQCEAYNSKFTVEEYDPNEDVCYGDSAAIKAGENMLYMSGPYALVEYTDYEVKFEKNPGYMAGTEHEPKITYVAQKFYKDATSAGTGFRSGEIDIMDSCNTNDVATFESEGYKVFNYIRHATTYAEFNMDEGSIMSDINLRKAVLYAINQEDFITYNNGLVGNLYSSFSTLIKTDNVLKQDLEKSAEYLQKYLDAQ